MNDLLQLALDAHGELERWRELRTVEATLSIGGELWRLKQKAELFRQIRIECSLNEQRVVTYLPIEDRRFVFTPNRIALESSDGQLLASRENPRTSMTGQDMLAPWDDLDAAYFNSYAVWTYLTLPFLYTWPGFTTEELPAWEERGERWWPLKVSFPPWISSHCSEQISYFGADGLLRRHKYTVEVLSNAPGLNYAEKYRSFDGSGVPTQRRVYAYDWNGQKIPEPLLVSIDIRQAHFR